MTQVSKRVSGCVSTPVSVWDYRGFLIMRIAEKVKNILLDILGLYIYKNSNELESYQIDGTKKSFLLSLQNQDIKDSEDIILKSLKRTFAFLQIKCGVPTIKDLHYQLIMWPIAIIFTNDEHWNDYKVHQKIIYWYWSTVFNSYFNKHQTPRALRDVNLLVDWVENDIENPFKDRLDNIFEQEEFCTTEILLNQDDNFQTPGAVVKFLEQFIVSKRPLDFKIDSNEVLDADKIPEQYKIERHHVIPLATAKTLKESSAALRNDRRHYLNSILNMTPISSEANRRIGSLSLDSYIKDLNKDALSDHYFTITDMNDYKDPVKVENFLKTRLENIKKAIKDTVKM